MVIRHHFKSRFFAHLFFYDQSIYIRKSIKQSKTRVLHPAKLGFYEVVLSNLIVILRYPYRHHIHDIYIQRHLPYGTFHSRLPCR